jgi:alpha-1,3-rhamnosyl/mannosyltransferase
MRAGVRIVAGRVGGIPEIAGRAPVYCDPKSGPSIMAAIRRVLQDTPEERREIAKASSARASEFTWDACAWKTLQAFKFV